MSSTQPISSKLVESFGLRAHLYAEDTQLYGYCCPSSSAKLSTRVLQAIDSIHAWMSSNHLSLNTGKTQFIWFGTRMVLAKRDMHQLSSRSPSLVELVTVKNLGFTPDQELSMKDHVSKLYQSCYYQLRQIRTIRHSLSPSAIRTLVHAFICSHIDFSNSLLYGMSAYLFDRLQSVLNSSARLILKIGKYEPISTAVRWDLHWLRIQARIQFKLNVITRNCLVGQAPVYLIELCRSINEIPARRNHVRQHKFSSWSLVSVLRALVVVASPSHRRNCGTYFQLTFDSYTRSHNSSKRDSKTHCVQQSIFHH